MSAPALDLTLLRLLKHRSKHERFMRGVPQDAIEAPALTMLQDYGKFFKENPDAQVAAPQDFIPFFRLLHPKLKDEKLAVFNQMLMAAGQDVPAEVEAGLVQRLTEARAAVDAATLLERYNAGEEINLMSHLKELADRAPVDDSRIIRFVDDDINGMLLDEQNEWGFKWRLQCMNDSMRPLRPGDLGIIGARVDRGKTTWLASELTYMAPQVDVMFPGENRIILYLNNEGMGKRIRQRLYQSALNASIATLIEKSKAGTLVQEYIEALGGRENIFILDVHDRPLSYLEDVVARTKPALVVADMLDVVPFDGLASNGGTRTDQILEASYQRARIWGVKYDTAVIAASQLSADADGELYPGLATLAGSKTGKPGAADWVAMLGASNDPLMQSGRWISLPKNKLARPGCKDPRAQVSFDGERARLNNPTVV